MAKCGAAKTYGTCAGALCQLLGKRRLAAADLFGRIGAINCRFYAAGAHFVKSGGDAIATGGTGSVGNFHFAEDAISVADQYGFEQLRQFAADHFANGRAEAVSELKRTNGHVADAERAEAVRISVADMGIMVRVTQGVRSVNLGAGDKLAAISPVLDGG
ncbi:MAG: hypothetical protein LBI39_00725 [Puniceicoccales bacterium]|nr:hypothetical protein [Puniceicoccales bacterium]